MKREYQLLPFRFAKKFGRVLLTSETGEHYFLSRDDFDHLVHHNLPRTSIYHDLKAKGFLCDQSLDSVLDTLANKYRTKHLFLFEQTSLHMFVVTYRCNQRCQYCHAASEGDCAGPGIDMDPATAKQAVEFAFQTPSQQIKIEFQGGEPLLNFDAVRTIVDHAREVNSTCNKQVEFVLCTNLLALRQEHLDFFREHGVVISTSLDGPKTLHDSCRKMVSGSGTYDRVIENINWAQAELDKGSVTALMTVTPESIGRLRDVVDEYLARGLDYIFIRKMNPLGFAHNAQHLAYGTDAFLAAYKDVLDYIIQINRRGTLFPEAFATILLARILSPFSTGFVDLQSPTGAGLAGVIYDTNGDVFISDEARMLHRTTGDKRFCIGTVWQPRSAVYSNRDYVEMAGRTCLELLPGCSWCVYKPYCGSDPVRNYYSQGDIAGHRPSSDFCRKYQGMFDILFEYLTRKDSDIQDVFWSWLTRRSVDQIRNYSIYHC